MPPLQQISALRQLIAQGNLELALSQLVVLLDSDTRFAELAQAARVLQADCFQNKAAVLKGTISAEDARIVTNQLNDSALSLLAQLESGQFPISATRERPGTWRYYVTGGIVALAAALLAWRIGGGGTQREGVCPDFGANYALRVMVLPFKQTGQVNATKPEYEISDGLNKLLAEMPVLQGVADVNEAYEVEKNYPSPSEAVELARNCESQMIVWGKINRIDSENYKLDVFYKLLDATGVRLTGDTTLFTLLKMEEGGHIRFAQDVDAVVRLLFVVLANRSGQPIAANFLEKHTDLSLTSADAAATQPDTALALALAYNLAQQGKKEAAISAYTQVIDAYPFQIEARKKRGALLYEKGEYAAAARDLVTASPDPAAASSAMLRLRVEAQLKSGQPQKAQNDLTTLQQQPAAEAEQKEWIAAKSEQISDSLRVLETLREKREKIAVEQPKSRTANLAAARTNYKLGNVDRSIDYADKVLKTNPKDREALELKIIAHAEKGDTTRMKEQIREAQRRGVSTKGILEKITPVIAPLYQEQSRKQRER